MPQQELSAIFQCLFVNSLIFNSHIITMETQKKKFIPIWSMQFISWYLTKHTSHLTPLGTSNNQPRSRQQPQPVMGTEIHLLTIPRWTKPNQTNPTTTTFVINTKMLCVQHFLSLSYHSILLFLYFIIFARRTHITHHPSHTGCTVVEDKTCM